MTLKRMLSGDLGGVDDRRREEGRKGARKWKVDGVLARACVCL